MIIRHYELNRIYDNVVTSPTGFQSVIHRGWEANLSIMFNSLEEAQKFTEWIQHNNIDDLKMFAEKIVDKPPEAIPENIEIVKCEGILELEC